MEGDRVARENELLRERLEEAERAARRWEAIARSSADAIALVDRNGTVTSITAASSLSAGEGAGPPVGTLLVDWVVPEDRAAFAAALLAVIETPATSRVLEARVRQPDGSLRWIESVTTNMLDEPAVGAVAASLRDITAKKREEADLRHSAKLLAEAQVLAHVGHWVSGGSSDAQAAWSAECARIFGREGSVPQSRAELCAMVHPDDQPRVIAAIELAGRERRPCETEHRILRPDGEVRSVRMRTSVSDGRTLLVVEDVTEQKRREDELHASEERYRRMVENTSEGVWMYDREGTTTFMNARMAEMLGWPHSEVVGQPIFAFMEPSEVDDAQGRLAQRVQGRPGRGAFRLRRLDGAELWISFHADPVRDALGNIEATLVLAADVTEGRRAEEAKNLLAAVVEGSDDAILSARLDGTVTFVNRRAEELFGYKAAELLGQPLSILMPKGTEDESIVDRIARGDTRRHFEAVRRRAKVTEAARHLPADVKLFVNLDASDLEDPTLADSVSPLSGIGHRVVLEITERASLEGIKNVGARIIALKAMGFRIAIDDLGAGYAGLTSFTQLEPDVVKIDMSLIRDVDKTPKKQAIISAMVALCHQLAMTVVAEGVETAAERDALADLGCDLLQGYLFGRPERGFKPPRW